MFSTPFFAASLALLTNSAIAFPILVPQGEQPQGNIISYSGPVDCGNLEFRQFDPNSELQYACELTDSKVGGGFEQKDKRDALAAPIEIPGPIPKGSPSRPATYIGRVYDCTKLDLTSILVPNDLRFACEASDSKGSGNGIIPSEKRDALASPIEVPGPIPEGNPGRPVTYNGRVYDCTKLDLTSIFIPDDVRFACEASDSKGSGSGIVPSEKRDALAAPIQVSPPGPLLAGEPLRTVVYAGQVYDCAKLDLTSILVPSDLKFACEVSDSKIPLGNSNNNNLFGTSNNNNLLGNSNNNPLGTTKVPLGHGPALPPTSSTQSSNGLLGVGQTLPPTSNTQSSNGLLDTGHTLPPTSNTQSSNGLLDTGHTLPPTSNTQSSKGLLGVAPALPPTHSSNKQKRQTINYNGETVNCADLAFLAVYPKTGIQLACEEAAGTLTGLDGPANGGPDGP